MILRIILYSFLAFPILGATSQTLPVGYPVLEDYIRRSQLNGEFDSTVSLSLRPLHSIALDDSSLQLKQYFGKLINGNSSGKFLLSLLPIQFQTEFNSHHPYGWNNGSMIRSRGLQTLLSAGIFAKLGVISIQLKPEWLFAQNRNYEGFPDSHSDRIWGARYSRTWNRIDLPERFGESSMSKMFPGQSSFRVNYGSFSVGISTENIWWGPGKNHSLIMTNNASGFAHLTLNTSKPVKTAIGTWEGQLIVGRLENSGFDPPSPDRGIQENWVRSKKEEWRYLNGLVLIYQPKWIPGLFLGTSRVIQNYHDSTKIKNDYLPVFSNFFRKNDPNQFMDGSRDQLLSIFTRWVWSEAKSEIYFEFGRSDASFNFRDLLMSPEHSSAYVIGVTKIVQLPKNNEFIEVSFEITHLELSKTRTLRREPTWYVNGKNRQGYTHLGEVLGAGIGPGSNINHLSVSWLKGFRKIGIQFERIVNDNDFYFATFGIEDFKRNWVDLSAGVNGSWNWKNYMIDGKLQFVKSKNYQWGILGEPEALASRNVSNLHFSARIAYSFN